MASTLNPFLWSTTAASNDIADSGINWSEGQSPGSVNASARGMMAAFARFLADVNGTRATTGASNAYAVAANLDHTALTNGLMLTIRANHTNSGAATLNLNGIGAKKMRAFTAAAGEGALAAGQIQSGGIYQLVYNTAADSGAGAWIMLNPTVDPTPPGSVQAFAGTPAPAGWLLCDGASYLRTDQAALFAVIGTTYGAADGTHFNVPDLRGRAVFGKDNMGGTPAGRLGGTIVGATLGATGGVEAVTLSAGEMPSHTHGTSALTATSNGAHAHTVNGATGLTGSNGAHAHTVNSAAGTTSSNGAHAHPGSAADNDGSHTHGIADAGNGIGNTGSGSAHHHGLSSAVAVSNGAHTHPLAGGVASGAAASHAHALSGGAATAATTTTGSGHGHAVSDNGHVHAMSGKVVGTATASVTLTAGATSIPVGTVANPSTDSSTTGITVNSGDGTHTHGLTGATDNSGALALSGQTDSAGAHTHTLSGNTDDESAHFHVVGISAAGSHGHNLTIASDGGHTHTVTIDSGGAHTHSVTIDSGGAHSHSVSGNTDATGLGGAHNNLPPAMILNWMIKA